MGCAVLPDAVLRHAWAYCIGQRLELGGGIRHRHACTDRLQHFQIIVAVTEGKRLTFVKPIVGQHLLDADALAAIGRDDIHRTVPPRSHPAE